MTSALCEIPRKTEPPDWESPAGGELVVPRVALGAYVYCGDGSVHWLAQPCDVLDGDQASDNEVDVTFACGCRASVPRGTLFRARR